MGAIIRSQAPAQSDMVFLELLGPGSQPLDLRAFSVIANREQAQTMVAHDRATPAGDNEWAAFFVECMVEFLVWSRPPAGRLTAEDLDWLEAQIGLAASPSMPALLFALVRELNDVPERLIALALRYSGNRRAALH